MILISSDDGLDGHLPSDGKDGRDGRDGVV
jgi:hypothetical protein